MVNKSETSGVTPDSVAGVSGAVSGFPRYGASPFVSPETFGFLSLVTSGGLIKTNSKAMLLLECKNSGQGEGPRLTYRDRYKSRKKSRDLDEGDRPQGHWVARMLATVTGRRKAQGRHPYLLCPGLPTRPCFGSQSQFHPRRRCGPCPQHCHCHGKAGHQQPLGTRAQSSGVPGIEKKAHRHQGS